MKKKVIVAMSGGVDSAISAYILKKQGYSVETVFMNNWDSRDEGGMNCTIDEDLKSIDKSCKVLGIEKIHHVNYQSSYWQRVFSPVLKGYRNGIDTPNPDILCNKEIKFGDLYEWAIKVRGADYLATGHYARIDKLQLRQARDLGKDQTYFLAAIDRNCLSRTLFPLGDLLKSKVKAEIVREADLNHLIQRKESMGLCFIGKRGSFQEFLSCFTTSMRSGPIIDLETGETFKQEHKGLSNYTIGQNVSMSGAKSKMYVAAKDQERNSLFVVDNLNHSALWSTKLRITSFPGWKGAINQNVYCVIRSVDKNGIKVKSITENGDKLEVELESGIFAPCPGQWAVFYVADDKSAELGRLCLGGGPIIKEQEQE